MKKSMPAMHRFRERMAARSPVLPYVWGYIVGNTGNQETMDASVEFFKVYAQRKGTEADSSGNRTNAVQPKDTSGRI